MVSAAGFATTGAAAGADVDAFGDGAIFRPFVGGGGAFGDGVIFRPFVGGGGAFGDGVILSPFVGGGGAFGSLVSAG